MFKYTIFLICIILGGLAGQFFLPKPHVQLQVAEEPCYDAASASRLYIDAVDLATDCMMECLAGQKGEDPLSPQIEKQNINNVSEDLEKILCPHCQKPIELSQQLRKALETELFAKCLPPRTY